jgi:hypothetical protein
VQSPVSGDCANVQYQFMSSTGFVNTGAADVRVVIRVFGDFLVVDQSDLAHCGGQSDAAQWRPDTRRTQ